MGFVGPQPFRPSLAPQGGSAQVARDHGRPSWNIPTKSNRRLGNRIGRGCFHRERRSRHVRPRQLMTRTTCEASQTSSSTVRRYRRPRPQALGPRTADRRAMVRLRTSHPPAITSSGCPDSLPNRSEGSDRHSLRRGCPRLDGTGLVSVESSGAIAGQVPTTSSV